MKRITQIDLCNYRAFYNELDNPNKYQISLPNGENLLIYGENGSGKSSFFKALHETFQSSKDASIAITNNIFSLTDSDLSEAEIKITISENTSENTSLEKVQEVIFNNSSPTTFDNQILIDSSASFLTYRDILKTYFLEIDNNDENPNLFNLIINGLIKDVSESSTYETVLDILNEIEDKVNSIEVAIKETEASMDESDPLKTMLETKGSDSIKDDIVGQIYTRIEELNLSITAILDNALISVNRYLDEFFNSNLEVSIENRDQYLSLVIQDHEYILNKNLKFDISYFDHGHGSESYQGFLNEARLSAVAICLHLAAIKLDQPFEENLKIIFLDDIFIGLDTSNRIPLLEILKEDFKDFQIFITTYDRHWYELAKSYLRNWKSLEMYVGENNSIHIEYPVIITQDLEYKLKAKRYIEAFDYPAAGNTIRKAFENKISQLLPNCYLYNETDLDGFFNKLILYYKNCCCEELIDERLKEELYIYKDIILNPTSHNDLRSPIYKAEVQKAYGILESIYALPLLKRVPIQNIGDILHYENSTHNYKAQYLLIETLYSISYGGNNHVFNIPNHKLIYWEYRNVPFSDIKGVRCDKAAINKIRNQVLKLSERPAKISHFLSLETLPNWQAEFRTTDGHSLIDMQNASL